MGELFNYGHEARLFPTVKSAEDRATSVFLATLNLVDVYRQILMKSVDKPVSKRGKDFTVYVHPQFGGKQSPKDIPDGMIKVIKSGLEWKCLIEVKINTSDLDQGQLERYLSRAVEKKCDALITISNEMCAAPDKPPLRLVSRDRRFKNIPYYHWSWKYLLHVAELLLREDKIEDDTQARILAEFVMFLRDTSSGISGFSHMNRNWKQFVTTLKVGGRPEQQDFEDVVADWHQESSELALILSDHFRTSVNQVIPRDQKSSPEKRLKEDVSLLKNTGDLEAIFDVEGMRHELKVVLEVDQRCLHFSVCHDLPSQVKTPYKRIERFLRVFQNEEATHETGKHSNVHIFAKWPYLTEPTDTTLFDALQATSVDELKTSKLINREKDTIQHVELKYTPPGVASAIQSPSKIISKLEKEVLFFCEHYVFV